MIDQRAAYVAGLEALAKLLEPASPVSIADWADRFRQLSAKTSAEPGQWRTSRIPFLRGIMDALEPWHPAPLVVIKKSAQVGGSEVILNWIGKTMDVAPRSFLALFPTDRVAARWMRARCDSMIKSTPQLRRLLPTGRRSGAGNSITEKHFPGAVLYTGSANRADDVASISVPNMAFDDADRMPVALDDEGDPIELALRRASTFPNSKSVLCSTPTTEDTSRVDPAWRVSTMDRYFVPCPHCGHFQWLRWEQVKWSPGKPRDAAYLCEDCAALIAEHSKTEILEAGEWRAEHPEREADVKGFHVNGLYTPIGLGDSWAKHAAAWERAEGRASRLQVFVNTRLGEVWKGGRQSVEWQELKKRAEPYRLRTVPPGVLLITTGTDVQADRLETQMLGWGREEQATVLDYQVYVGDTTRPEVWAELDAYLAKPLASSKGVPMLPTVSLIDSSYLTDHVLNFTRPRRSRGIFASRGSPIATKDPIGRPSYPDVKRWSSKPENDKRGAERYDLGVSKLKSWLLEQLRGDVGADGQIVTPAQRHVRFSVDLSDEYFRQLTAEAYDPKEGWVKRYERNEALDTMIAARAAALHHKAGVHKFREADWVRLEQLYEPANPPGGATGAPAAGGPPTPPALPSGFLPTRAKVRNSDGD